LPWCNVRGPLNFNDHGSDPAVGVHQPTEPGHIGASDTAAAEPAESPSPMLIDPCLRDFCNPWARMRKLRSDVERLMIPFEDTHHLCQYTKGKKESRMQRGSKTGRHRRPAGITHNLQHLFASSELGEYGNTVHQQSRGAHSQDIKAKLTRPTGRRINAWRKSTVD
jgi:hypothetical protein